MKKKQPTKKEKDVLQLFKNSLSRLKTQLRTRIQSEITATGADATTVSSKMEEVDKAIGDGTISEWLVTNLPQLVAELGPLIQAIMTLIAMFGK